MDFEQIRQELFRLNDLRNRASRTDRQRAMRTDIRSEQGETERGLVNFMNASNPERITWEDVNREVAALEEQIVRETGFGVTYWSRSTDGVEIAGSYVLVPKNEGWLEVMRQQTEE
ncbi:MAG: hypothetical protein ACJ8DI_08315 [Ktedonobacteraceae bacterium]